MAADLTSNSSKTRNKIQAILSSFMHEKDEFGKERNAERDIADNPGLLSMLCQPRNRENFYDRVETFSPLYLSPQHCALYGWENTDVDLLTCVSCKATLDGMVGTQWDLDTYNSTCAELRSSIINGHSKFCPWNETPCPESFLSLPTKTAQEWKTSFEDSCRNLLKLEGDLPVLKREAFQALDIPEDVLSLLSNSITDNDSSSYNQDVIDTICVLALCGWNTSNSSGILCCSACHREAGLWNFHSLKNVTLINNDGAQPCNVTAEVTSDNDGHIGSPGVMEEDTGTQGESITVQEDMVCDDGVIRDKDSLKTGHVETGNDDGEQEHTGSQEVMMDNDDYAVDTNGGHEETKDILGNQVDEKVQEVENQGFEENPSINMESSKMSPLCGSTSEEIQDENVTSESFTSSGTVGEISIIEVEDSVQNTSDQIGDSESQPEPISGADMQEQSTQPSGNNSLLHEPVTMPPEHTIASEQQPHSEEGTLTEQGHQDIKEPPPVKDPLPVNKPISEHDPLPKQQYITEKESPLKQEPLSDESLVMGEDSRPGKGRSLEEESACAKGFGEEHNILSQPETGEDEMRDVADNPTQPPGFSENEYATDSDVLPDQGGGEPAPGMSTEPSRLFGAGFFSPAHSRQDSLIVELGEDSMSERMQSIQADLLDRGETASQMDSCRSLSEWSEGDVNEPTSKRLKTDDMEQIEFDVLAEHRNWCPWVTAVPSARDTTENVQKLPGWKILLEHLVQFTSPGQQAITKQTPPTQVWKSVRRLFHDCQTTIMRSHVPSIRK